MKREKSNEELIESQKLTTFRDRVGIYGQRLILRLIEFANKEGSTGGIVFKKGKDIRKVEVNALGDRLVTLPLTDIIGDSEDYDAVKSSIRALVREIIENKDEEGIRFSFTLLSYAQISKGTLTVEISKEMWQVFIGLHKGFQWIDLETALKLKSAYSRRLYKLVSEQREMEYIDFQLEDLKKMLWVTDRCSQTKDFFSKVIKPAKTELDQIAPWSFDYESFVSKECTKEQEAIIGVRIFPIYHPENSDSELAEKRLYTV